MNDDIEKLSFERILTADEISFSELEAELAERFNITAEQFRKLLLESESLEDFLKKMNMNQKG